MKNRLRRITTRPGVVVVLVAISLVLLTQCFAPTVPAGVTVTIENDGNGSTDPSGSVSVFVNEPLAISATPNAGCAFGSWTVESGSGVAIEDPDANSTSMTVTEDNVSIMANFVEQCSLSVTSNGDGTTVPAGTITVAHGIATGITATPNPGSAFTGWNVVTGTPIIADRATAATTVTLATGDAAISAGFSTIPKVYVANYDDDTVSVIDGLDGTVLTTVPVGVAPGAVGVNSATGKVYVVHYDGETKVINGSTDTVVGTIAYSGWDYPSVAVDPSTNRIFAASQYDAVVLVIDGGTDTLAETFDDYTGYAGTYLTGMGVNPVTGKIYIIDWGDSSLYIYNASPPYALVDSLSYSSDEKGGVAVNPITNRIYVPDVSNTLFVIDGATDTEVTSITVGSWPTGVAVNTVTNMVYVTNENSDTVSVIDGSTNSVVTTIPVGDAPLGVAVSESFNMVYAVNSIDGTVSIIDCRTHTVTDTIGVGNNPQFVGVLE